MQVALFQPDFPHNVGSILRLCACLGAPLHLIEPCGFPLSDKRIREAALDYGQFAAVSRHLSWPAFVQTFRTTSPAARILLMTTKAAMPYTTFTYQPGDCLLLGRESAGVPTEVHEQSDARLLVPMQPPARSLNVALAAAMVLGEALRQTRSAP